MLLKISSLDIHYGRNHAVKSIDIELEEREIITILGANGAGKSSLLKAIQGTTRATNGTISLDGQEISKWSASKRVFNGLVLVPEGRQIFVSLSVHENLLMGAYCRHNEDLSFELEAIYEYFPNLAERKNMLASVLSGGEQQMLAIGRALLAKPKIMMLDEPSLGLSPILVQQLFEYIQKLNREGLTIILVEQNTNMALKYAHRGYVLELGKIVASGTSQSLLSDKMINQAYFGET
ncbi:MAG: ABC transporter ATP-binding protein [Rhizobiaceae bacterium]